MHWKLGSFVEFEIYIRTQKFTFFFRHFFSIIMLQKASKKVIFNEKINMCKYFCVFNKKLLKKQWQKVTIL